MMVVGIAQELADHKDVRKTALYGRRANKIGLDKIEQIKL